MSDHPHCPFCKGELSFLADKDVRTGGIDITITCELCDLYAGFTNKNRH